MIIESNLGVSGSAWRRASVMVMAACLAACGAETPAPSSQVAARVNKGEISVHQVQSVLERQPRLLTDHREAAPGRVLDVLVDQELAAQAALRAGLERDPNVLQAMQVARREVLARAYHESVTASVPGPSSDEIDRYYNSQPALFSKRRLYTLQEFVVAAKGPLLEKLKAAAQQARSPEEMQSFLRDNRLPHRGRQFVQASEDLPLAILEPMSKLEPGQSLVLQQGAGARVFTVVDARLAPVDRVTANEAIAGYLTADRKRQQLAHAMKELKDQATIVYLQPDTTRAAAAAQAEPQAAK
jgi:EpsD family peptidyl-prolyl cis-trans isomerase